MNKRHILWLILLFLVFLIGCTYEDKSIERVANEQIYTKEQCEEFEKFEIRDTILIISGEVYFRYTAPECKDYQILKCRYIDRIYIEANYPSEKYSSSKARKGRIFCYLSIALDYKDNNLCEYLFEEEEYDIYWYCKSVLAYGKSSCSHIKDDYWHSRCIEDAE